LETQTFAGDAVVIAVGERSAQRVFEQSM